MKTSKDQLTCGKCKFPILPPPGGYARFAKDFKLICRQCMPKLQSFRNVIVVERRGQ
jgi:hypothetical protein